MKVSYSALWTRPTGVRVQRVQRVQKVQRVVVGGSAASLYKTFIIALAGEGKQANRAYGARKYTPIPLRGLPPEGEVCSMPSF